MYRNCFRLVSFVSFVTLLQACDTDQRSENPSAWTEDQVAEWFDERTWLGETDMKPDPSIDKREFAIQYHRHQDRWDKAFAFLKKEELSNVAAGNHPLDGSDVFVKVTEYNSKNPEDIFYESHQHYADIQFVVSGMEYIGRTDLSTATEKTPYDSAKDIQFYHVSNGKNLLAKPGTFFIFFGQDAHCPGIKVNENAPVKKMVIKVRN